MPNNPPTPAELAQWRALADAWSSGPSVGQHCCGNGTWGGDPNNPPSCCGCPDQIIPIDLCGDTQAMLPRLLDAYAGKCELAEQQAARIAEAEDLLVLAAGELGGCAGYITGLRNLADGAEPRQATQAYELARRIASYFPKSADTPPAQPTGECAAQSEPCLQDCTCFDAGGYMDGRKQCSCGTGRATQAHTAREGDAR